MPRIEPVPDAHKVLRPEALVGAERQHQWFVRGEIVDEAAGQLLRTDCPPESGGIVAGKAHEFSQLRRIFGEMPEAEVRQLGGLEAPLVRYRHGVSIRCFESN